MNHWNTILITLTLCATTSVVLHTQRRYDANPGNYQSQLGKLNAGDTLVFTAGNYTNGINITNMHGAPDRWITLRSVTPQAAVFLGKPGKNTIDIFNSSYIWVVDFLLDGQNIPDIDGIKAGGGGASNYTHHIWIDGNVILGHGESQQVCGISTKLTSWDWIISHNIIRGAGTAIYLGNSDGTMPFIRGVIEYNLIENPTGYCMQIKHQLDRPNIAGIPGNGQTTIIRHNVFAKDDRISPDGDRPNLLVDGQPLSGPGIDDRVEIYGNLLYYNPRENLFQGTGNLSVHDNIFVNTKGGCVNLQPHNNRAPKEVFLYHNTVYSAGTGARLSAADVNYQQVMRGNAVFAATPFSPATSDVNLTGTMSDALQYFNSPSGDINTMDFYPKSGAATSQIDLAPFTKDISWQRDFNDDPQNGTTYGAYAGSGTNPGWKPSLSIKTIDYSTTRISDLHRFPLHLDIWPNPARTGSIVWISGARKENSSLRLCDVFGKTVSTVSPQYKENGVYTFLPGSVSPSLPTGLYFLMVESAHEVRVVPLTFLR